MILPVFFAATLILHNFWFAPSSWLAAVDSRYLLLAMMLAAGGQQQLLVHEHERQ
jgi:hypothetical protein